MSVIEKDYWHKESVYKWRKQSIKRVTRILVSLSFVVLQFATPPISYAKENNLNEKFENSIWGVEVNACNFSGDEARRLAREGILIGSNSADNYLDLKSGNILLHPEKDMVIKTKEGEAHIFGGSSIFIRQNEEGVVFYVLAQTQQKKVSIKVFANKQKVLLDPGQMLVLTHNSNNFEKVSAVKTNFSIASAMTFIGPLKTSIKSTNGHDSSVASSTPSNF